MFELDPRLASDTHLILELDLCSARLLDDARYPWVILVPRVANLIEFHDLDPAERAQLQAESDAVSGLLITLFQPTVLNVGKLGNIVRQLHIHHIARFENDPAWPGPVWGHSPPEAYSRVERSSRLGALRDALRDALINLHQNRSI